MTGGPRIIPIEQDEAASGPDACTNSAQEAIELAPEWLLDEEEAVESAGGSRRRDVIVGGAVAAAIIGWTGFFVWANQGEILAGGTPAQWSQWVIAWSMPTLLCLVILLVVMRTSRREGARFAEIAATLNRESEALEQRLRSANGELSLARDFIASQSRDLEALGRIAVERLSSSASELAGLISSNGTRVDSIATVAQSALENMEKLRGQLPVIANAAKDVTNNIGNAGRTAHVQLEDLVAGFQRLNEFGLASERQVASTRDAVAAAVTEMATQAEHLGQIAQGRFAAITAEGEQHRHRLDQEEIAALASIRSRAAALGEELAAHRAAAQAAETAAADAIAARLASLRQEADRIDAEIAVAESSALASWTERAAVHASSLHEALAALDGDQREVIEAGADRFRRFAGDAEALVARLREQMEGLDGELARRRVAGEEAARDAVAAIDLHLADLERSVAQHQERQFERSRDVAVQCAAIGERVNAFAETIVQAGAHGEATRQKVEQALGALEQKLAASRDALSGTDRDVASLTDASVRLLEIIQAGSDHARTHIPEALGAAERSLKGMEDRIFMLRDTLGEANKSGQSLSGYMLQTRQDVGATMGELHRLQEEMGERTNEQHHRIASLREALVGVRGETEALAGEVRGTLEASIERLSAAARDAGNSLGSGAEGRIVEIADQLREAGSGAVARIIEEQAAELASGIEKAVARAAETGRETAVQLRDQLARVDELAGNLESRVARARERAEEQVDNDFARRVALISESLSSHAIDIVKVLSTEVTDTAWAAYLRGDRGIFTRRAVSLLDSTEAKAVLHHYERDSEFQSHVNQFIHDFEAMLRQLLSTRDGNALGVTLLSSDMGKLYVALAQAIERLRA